MHRSQRLPPPREDRTSVLLRQILQALAGEYVTVGQIVVQFRRRSFGGILFALTLLGLLPVISFLAGLVILIPAFQMAAGLQTARLPQFIAQRRIPVKSVLAIGNRALPYLERTERYIRPRWLILTTPPMPMLIGVVILVLALVLILPVPLVNFPPAVALFLLSIGILERDGAMLLAGLVVAALAIALGAFAMLLVVEGGILIYRSHFG